MPELTNAENKRLTQGAPELTPVFTPAEHDAAHKPDLPALADELRKLTPAEWALLMVLLQDGGE